MLIRQCGAFGRSSEINIPGIYEQGNRGNAKSPCKAIVKAIVLISTFSSCSNDDELLLI